MYLGKWSKRDMFFMEKNLPNCASLVNGSWVWAGWTQWNEAHQTGINIFRLSNLYISIRGGKLKGRGI